ncbi:MAG: glutamine--fructose-6-phosphate transaminase (isomerizing) [Candidatus Aminicenantes bacterium 4484_214]|nr:MAG: glutamine--fructose-6-phosphate transaminase (isomerizing) [Candidatus Aminicenantes bacterium 4484_214]
MCGIIGYSGRQNPIPILIDGLKKLEYRGYDSAGVAIFSGGDIKRLRVKGKISLLEEKIKQLQLDGSCGLGHTRWATHGVPSEENAHPHRSCGNQIILVHNGIIENYHLLKERLLAEGHQFESETDSEVIAHLVEKYYAGCLEEAVSRAVQELEGAFAIAVISRDEPDKIVVAKLGPPAVVGFGDGENIVASDVNPLLSYTNKVAFLEDREIAILTPNEIRFTDFTGKPIEKRIEILTWSPLMIEKRGFKHFMLKEIFEQPQVIRETMEGRIKLDKAQVLLDETGLSLSSLKRIKRLVMVACGTSFHAGLLGKYYVETLARIPVEVVYASEYRYHEVIPDGETLAVFISQSGETADTLASLRQVKKLGLSSLAICNVAQSSIARESDGVFYTHAGPEIGVAATKTFSAQLTALFLLAVGLAQLQNNQEERLNLIQAFRKIPWQVEALLGQKEMIDALSARFLHTEHFLYLGRWVNYPIALEGALKLKEISYIHAEAYPGGEMKHGPIALIDEKMPTMAICPQDKVYEKMLSNIMEVKARQGVVIALATQGDESIKKKVDQVIYLPSTHPLLFPFLSLIPLQLFAYCLAARRGADVDQPRNLAKSVTVE